MRNLGVLAFGVTTCVLVPTALHVLQAGPNEVAKLVAPGARTLTVGNATVDVELDKAFIDPGQKVHVTLTASASGRQRVALDVLVLESTGTSGGRVETPPVHIARETVTLDAKPGKSASKTLAFTLRGVRSQTMEGQEPFGHYTILVMPPTDADKLEKLRRAADRVDNPMEDAKGYLGAFELAFRSIDGHAGAPAQPSDGSAAPAAEAAAADGDDDPRPFGTPGQIARFDVNTRAYDSPVTIEAPDTALAGYDITVHVKASNPSSKALSTVHVGLETKPYYMENDYLGIDANLVTISQDTQTIALAAHETKDVEFHVMTKQVGTLGLFATQRCDGDDCYGHGMWPNDAALDAISIVAPPPREPAPRTADATTPAASK